MRGMVAWLVAGLLVLSGCSDGSQDDAASGEAPTTSASVSPTTEEATEEASEVGTPGPSTTEPISPAQFCDLVRDIATGGEAETRAAMLELLQRGLPEELDGDAHSGLQVLLDHATEFGSVRDSWRAYRALEKGERADLRALTWWVTKTCGTGYLDDLTPDLPEMPKWLTDPKIPGRG